MNSRFKLLSIFLLCSWYGYGQKADLMNFVPVSANAASLGKFGNVPVSYYTGVPSIEVPLYTIEQGSLKIPVNLSYHAGGIKVSEIASWVGLGWGLSAGGTITRNERGLQDDWDNGYLRNGKTIDESSLTIVDYYNAGRGWLDLEADEFSFNFPGGSGRFTMDQQAHAFPIPHQQLKIYPLDVYGDLFTTSSISDIRGWKIITTDGVQYFFQAMETTKNIPSDYGEQSIKHQNAWNLTKIVSADKADTIIFEYDDGDYTTQIPMSETLKLLDNEGGTCGDGIISTPLYLAMQNFGVKRLHKIIFENGYIQFFPAIDDRCDLLGDEWLDKVKVFDDHDNLIKEIQLKYGYMLGDDITPAEEFPCDINYGNGTRLMLLSVQETGKSPYKFDYIHDIGLPTRFSCTQDHWGFYNRPHNDLHSLIPEQIELSPYFQIMGTNREANVAYGKQGTLQKITYPTGGNTQFEYEAHTAELSTLKNFPEFSSSYTIVPNAARTFSVDYGYNNHEIASFTISYLDGAQTVAFKAENFVESSGCYFKVVNTSNQDYVCSLNSIEGSTRYFSCGPLPNGTYRIMAMKEPPGSGNPIGVTYSLTLQEYNSVTGLSSYALVTIGGLRVKKITDTDPLTGNVQTKEFEYFKGALTWGIKYSSRRKEYLCYEYNGETHMLDSYTIGSYYVLSGNSNYPMSNTQGAPVGYRSVIMRDFYIKPDQTKVDNGYTKFNYTTSFNYPDEGFSSSYKAGVIFNQTPYETPSMPYSDNTTSLINYQFPYAPPCNNDWKRGLLTSKIMYKKNAAGVYSAISGEYNTYEVTSVVRYIRSVRCGVVFDPAIHTSATTEDRPLIPPLGEVAFSYYYTNGEYLYLKSSGNSVYNDAGDSVGTSTNYFYDNPDHLLPNRTVTTSSDLQNTWTVTTYPQDYATGTGFIDALVAQNNLSVPIENVVYKEDPDGVQKVTNGILFTYLNDGKGLKDNIKVLENADNIDMTSFKFSNRLTSVIPTPATSKTAFAPYSLYTPRVTFNQYSNARLLEQQKVNDAVYSYVWDYGNQYPVAQVTNASVNAIAYTGFEGDAFGNWSQPFGGSVNTTTAQTGDHSYSLSAGNTISKGSLPSGNYIVSYWSKNGSMTVNGATVAGGISRSGWTYFEHKLATITNVTITVSGSFVIDDLRLYPAGAQMTTYTYKPLVGVSSITDPNNTTNYYQYDAAGRLEVVMDFDGKVVQHYKYHYKGQ